MNVTEQMARYVVETRYADLPQKTVQYAKNLTLTNLASMLWGSTLPAGKLIIKFVKDVGGTPEAGVVGGGFKTSLPNAALANGTFAHAVEWEGDSRPEMVASGLSGWGEGFRLWGRRSGGGYYRPRSSGETWPGLPDSNEEGIFCGSGIR